MKAPQAKRVACAEVLGESVSWEKRREHVGAGKEAGREQAAPTFPQGPLGLCWLDPPPVPCAPNRL